MGWDGQIWLPQEGNTQNVDFGLHSNIKSLVVVNYVCALRIERVYTHTTQVMWLLASLSRHHIEAQRESVTDPHSEREEGQDGYRNVRRVSCVLNGHESTQCIFLTHLPLYSPH